MKPLLSVVVAIALSTSFTYLARSQGNEENQQIDALFKEFATFYQQGDYAKAAACFEKGLPFVERVRGRDHILTAKVVNNIGVMYAMMDQPDKAAPYIRRALEIRETKLGFDHRETTESLNNLATLYRAMDDFDQAEKLYLRSLKFWESKLGPDHPDVTMALSNLGSLHQALGRYGSAEAYYKRSLKIREAKLGPQHVVVAEVLNQLANLYQITGRYAGAETHYERCLKVFEDKLGRDHLQVSFPVNDMAVLYDKMGQFAKAEEMYLRSLTIREAKLGPKHSYVAQTLGNLATLYRHTGRTDKAESAFLRAIEIRQAIQKGSTDLVAPLTNLAGLYRAMNKQDKVEPLYRQCLKIVEDRLGKDHPDAAAIMINLASWHEEQGQPGKAEPLYRRALEICRAKLGDDHPVTAKSLSNLAWFCAEQGLPESMKHADQARRVMARHVAQVLPSLAEPEQEAFLGENVRKGFQRALSLAHYQAKIPGAAADSAAWLINGKGLTHQALAEQHLLARDAKDPKTMVLVNQLQEARALLAALTNKTPKYGQEEALLQRRKELHKQVDGLARKVALVVGRPFRDEPWVEVDEVRKKLGNKAVLVDIVNFPVYDFKAGKSGPAHYMAWITPPLGKGDVKIIDLGAAEPIDRALQEARKAIIESAGTLREVGEPEADKVAFAKLQALGRKVLHPLLPAIGGYTDWILCPDGALWLAPWSALPLPDGTYAVEKHVIRHVISGRDLVIANPPVKASGAWVFADPDFDATPSQVMARTRDLLGNPGISSGPELSGKRLKGTIGTWNVSFDFKEKGIVLIRDDDDGGAVAGQGKWTWAGGKLTMQTQLARFDGTVKGNTITGQRVVDGKTDVWHLKLPAEMVPQTGPNDLRFAGTAVGKLPQVKRLPATAVEAESISPKLKALLGSEPRVHSELTAAESLVKSVSRPRILALATHGYFLPDQEFEPKNKRLAGPENPLLRCGLLLAGCNKRDQAKPGDEDGILTGLEIVGMDLRGCELVVLSACETGIGDVRNGEGVAGLRQAFMLAGAENVLASLWQVSDRETALLMNEFFTNLTKNQSKAEALRNAQLSRLEARRRQFGAAHPFYWAAFTVTGK